MHRDRIGNDYLTQYLRRLLLPLLRPGLLHGHSGLSDKDFRLSGTGLPLFHRHQHKGLNRRLSFVNRDLGYVDHIKSLFLRHHIVAFIG